MESKIFHITPPSQSAINFGVGMGIVVFIIMIVSTILVVFLFARMFVSFKEIKIEISDSGLKIGGMYGRLIPKEYLKLDEAMILNLNDDKNSEYTPIFRTNGAALPGFNLGWYRLKNKKKGLLFITDRTKVLLIPTDKYILYMSSKEAEEMLASMRSLW